MKLENLEIQLEVVKERETFNKSERDWLIETCRKLIAQNRVMKPALEEIRQYYDNVGEPTCEHETAEKALAEVERLENE